MTAIEEFLKELGSDSESKDALLLIRAMSDNISYYKRLLERFELDSLTGLPGSNKYHEFKAALGNSPAESVGVIVFDVNDLKYYNDNLGHQAGDLLLQKAADSFHFICNRNGCRTSCRRAVDSERFDYVCKNIRVFRTGGDEFVAIVTDCAEKDLDGILAEWRGRLSELNAADDGITCTIAWGAAFGAGEYRLGDILQLADERMYAEKRRMKESGLKLGEMR
jgi:GGDEF domain-containing protein